MARRHGFTLIEILAVILIILILMGMLLPMIGMARKSASITSTRALIKRVSTALESFRADVGAYPYQDHALTFPEPNRLAWQLAHDMTSSEVTELREDAAEAAGRYDPSSAYGDMVLDRTHMDTREAATQHTIQESMAGQVNRMAATRARIAVYAGATHITGIKAFGGYDRSAHRLVPQPRSRGFARDYLGDEISPKEIRGDAIIDRWGQPLIYVCPVMPGVKGSYVPGSMGRTMWDPNHWAGRQSDTIDEAAYGLQMQGRAETDSRASDIRTTAAAAWTRKPEIWSAGPDRRATETRSDAANTDNIAVEPYLRELR